MLSISEHLHGRSSRITKKWKRQRIRRGFADCDLWNMDMHLLQLLPVMLRRLAEITHGYPGDMNSMEEWEQWLRDTADMFQFVYEHDEFDEFLREEREKKFDMAMDRLKERFFDLWD